jgi:hypothetical protein
MHRRASDFKPPADRRSSRGREPGALAAHAGICAEGAESYPLSTKTIWWETEPVWESEMLDGVMLLWFLLTAAALLFVAVDIRLPPNLRCSNGGSCY